MRSFIVALVFCFFISPAAAQPLCGPYDDLVGKLKADFKEAQAGSGVSVYGRSVELFVSKEGGWSIVVKLPTGAACLVDSGDGWEIREPKYADGSA